MPVDSSRLTRRQLLARAGAVGGAMLLGGGSGTHGVTARAAGAPPAASRPPMLKGVSLIGDVNPYDDSLAVRPYLLGGPRRAELISFWVSWGPTQPFRPDPVTAAQSLRDLGDPAGPAAPAWAALDAQIAQANADGMQVALTLYQSFPEWTHPSADCLMPSVDPQQGGPGYAGQGRAGNGARIPDDRGLDGPWAWFLDYLCARYSDTGGEATPGPGRDGATVGNPRAAKVDWLAPMNEPNLTWWPQRSPELYADGEIASAAAELMRSAATVAGRYRTAAATPRGPALLGPNTSDVLDPDDLPERGTAWRPFTEGVLRNLAGWQPEVPVGWAHHNYMDVKYGPQRDGRWRVEELLGLLDEHGWDGGDGGGVWLTEGGYTFGVRQDGPDPGHWLVDPGKTASGRYADVFAEQAALLQANWEAMAGLPVRLWSQYQVNDRDVRFQSGLRGPVRDQPDGTRALFDPPYPAYDLWPRLGA
jgi:hypothetical protein